MWRAPKRPSRDTMYLERAGEEMSAPTHGKLHGELVRGRERCRGGRAVHGWAGASSWGGAHRLGSMFCTQEHAAGGARGAEESARERGSALPQGGMRCRVDLRERFIMRRNKKMKQLDAAAA